MLKPKPVCKKNKLLIILVLFALMNYWAMYFLITRSNQSVIFVRAQKGLKNNDISDFRLSIVDKCIQNTV